MSENVFLTQQYLTVKSSIMVLINVQNVMMISTSQLEEMEAVQIIAYPLTNVLLITELLMTV